MGRFCNEPKLPGTADRSANSNWLWGEKSQIDFNKNTYLQADRENFLRFAHRFNMFKPATRRFACNPREGLLQNLKKEG